MKVIPNYPIRIKSLWIDFDMPHKAIRKVAGESL